MKKYFKRSTRDLKLYSGALNRRTGMRTRSTLRHLNLFKQMIFCIEVLYERSQNTILVMSTQVHYLSHRTVQYGRISSFHALAVIQSADSGESRSTSRVAHSSVAASCTYVSAINASKCIQHIHCV